MASVLLSDSEPAVISGFPAVSAPDARLLILGSMPGLASLRAQRYYAHPQNQFWPIMGSVLGFNPQADYALRCAALETAGIAVWDVLQSCVRPSSLDSAIDTKSAKPNDFASFLLDHPLITHIAFNGNAAHKIFQQRVQPALQGRTLTLLNLPSSSPAYASLRPQAKLAAWKAQLEDALSVIRACQ